MATKNICPRAHGEGSLGKDGRSWGDARLLALNGQSLNASGVGDENGFGLGKEATQAETAAGTLRNRFVSPHALMGTAHPFKLSEGHEFPAGLQPIACTLEIFNDGGTLKHRFMSNVEYGEPGIIGPVESPSTVYAAFLEVGAGVDFAGGAGWALTNGVVLDVPDLDGLAGKITLNASLGRQSGCSSLRRATLYSVTLDVNGVVRRRPMIVLGNDVGGTWAINTTNIPSGSKFSIYITGYLPKQS